MEDVTIKIYDREDQPHEITVPLGMDLNLMEICKAEGLEVEGTCGGMALCSTCHIYILNNNSLPESQDAEEDMLDQAFFVEENSRLGCQLTITEEFDGLEVKLAPTSF